MRHSPSQDLSIPDRVRAGVIWVRLTHAKIKIEAPNLIFLGFVFFFFDHAAHSMWDLSSPIRDQTHTP